MRVSFNIACRLNVNHSLFAIARNRVHVIAWLFSCSGFAAARFSFPIFMFSCPVLFSDLLDVQTEEHLNNQFFHVRVETNGIFGQQCGASNWGAANSRIYTSETRIYCRYRYCFVTFSYQGGEILSFNWRFTSSSQLSMAIRRAQRWWAIS